MLFFYVDLALTWRGEGRSVGTATRSWLSVFKTKTKYQGNLGGKHEKHYPSSICCFCCRFFGR